MCVCVCLPFLTRTIVFMFVCKVAQKLSHSPVLECLHRVCWRESRKVNSGLNLTIHSLDRNGKRDDRVTNRYMPLISLLHLLLVRAKKMWEVLQEIYLKRERLPSLWRSLSTSGLFLLKAFVLRLVPSSLICTILISSKPIHVNKNVSSNNDEGNRLDERRNLMLIFFIWTLELECKQSALLLKGTNFSWLQLVINSNHVFCYVFFQSFSWKCKYYGYNERGKLSCVVGTQTPSRKRAESLGIGIEVNIEKTRCTHIFISKYENAR